MENEPNTQLTLEEQSEITIQCDFSTVRGMNTNLEIKVENNDDLKGLRRRIYEAHWTKDDENEEVTDEKIRARMKIFRPLFREQAIDFQFDDSTKIKDILQKNEEGIYELYIATQNLGGSKVKNPTSQLFVICDGKYKKHVIVGKENSFTTVEIDDEGTNINLNHYHKKNLTREQHEIIKKHRPNKQEPISSLIIINNIIKTGKTFKYETLDYFIPGMFDIKIHQDGSISLFEKNSLAQNHNTPCKEILKAEDFCDSSNHRFDARFETDNEKEDVDQLFYIEMEKDSSKPQFIITGDQKDFKTIRLDTRGGQYKLKTGEGNVRKFMEGLKKRLDTKKTLNLELSMKEKLLIVVDEVTQVDDFRGGIQYQYNTLEYSIPFFCDILIHDDKSITLYEKGNLQSIKKSSMSVTSSEENVSVGVGERNVHTPTSDTDDSNSEAPVFVNVRDNATGRSPIIKFEVFEAKRDAFRESRNARMSATEKGTALGNVLNSPVATVASLVGCI